MSWGFTRHDICGETSATFLPSLLKNAPRPKFGLGRHAPVPVRQHRNILHPPILLPLFVHPNTHLLRVIMFDTMTLHGKARDRMLR